MCYPQCVHPCSECPLGSPTSCSNCYAGYIHTGTICNEDFTCNGTSSCTTCARTYYLSSGKCLSCNTGSNCVQCDSNSPAICTQCLDGYYVKNDACTACPTICIECASSEFC